MFGRHMILTFRHFSLWIFPWKQYITKVCKNIHLCCCLCDIVAVLLGPQSCLSHQGVWTCVIDCGHEPSHVYWHNNRHMFICCSGDSCIDFHIILVSHIDTTISYLIIWFQWPQSCVVKKTSSYSYLLRKLKLFCGEVCGKSFTFSLVCVGCGWHTCV